MFNEYPLRVEHSSQSLCHVVFDVASNQHKRQDCLKKTEDSANQVDSSALCSGRSSARPGEAFLAETGGHGRVAAVCIGNPASHLYTVSVPSCQFEIMT